MAGHTPIPDITQLEPKAADVLFSEELMLGVEEHLEDRAVQYLTATMALGMVGLTHEWASRQYWGAKTSLRGSRRRFARSYNKLYPNDPISLTESIEVARMVIELAHLDHASFE